MKEFMFLIKNKIDHKAEWPEAQHQEFLKKCEVYIRKLKEENRLISAQPLIREGVIVSGKSGSWNEASINETGEVQVGYYHILAKDIDAAVEIAKGNPEFEYGSAARIEVRPIKTKEVATGFVYPKTA